jgi:hypothetical protein
VQLSRDGGMTWEVLASNLTGTGYDWTASGAITGQARVRVLASDNQGLLGYDTGGLFTISGPSYPPPHSIDGSTLIVDSDGDTLFLTWKAPDSDPTHGPATSYKVLRAGDARGPWSQAGAVTLPEFSESATVAPGTAIFYRIVSVNPGGESN